MKAQHRKMVGLQAASLKRAAALESQIADRARVVERDLLKQAKDLREAMRGEKSEYRLRRLERKYLRCMWELAQVRKVHALARATVGGDT